ncbi:MULTISPECIES: hypothetical protein [unclassified Streptococcus]|uniref:hypothetical protein n=1 Tax=unclassified Streptococcus TaxID=2608887 RepID=UPI00359CFB23
MRYIYRLLIARRWYIFVSIILLGFVMNFLTFYESSRLFRYAPQLIGLYHKRSDNDYEIIHLPYTINQRIIPNSSEETEEFYNIIKETFFDKDISETLYYNKWGYIEGGSLQQLTFEEFREKSSFANSGTLDELFLDDLLVRNTSKSTLSAVTEKFKTLNINMSFESLNQRLSAEVNYYVVNFLFGLGAALFILIFVLALLYWLIQTSLNLYQDDIRLLSIVGANKQDICIGFSLLLFSPIFLASILVIIFAHAIGFGAIAYDYIYLLCFNAFVLSLIYFIVKSQLRKSLNA